MKAIKIIDLLNMIANGEEVPEKIRVFNEVYKYDFIDGCYRDIDSGKSLGFSYRLDIMLHNEVEIIEDEETPNKIKKIDFMTLNTQKEKNRAMKDTINKLVDVINRLLKKEGE